MFLELKYNYCQLLVLFNLLNFSLKKIDSFTLPLFFYVVGVENKEMYSIMRCLLA